MPKCNANGITLDFETGGNPADPAIILIRGTGSQRVRWQKELLDGLSRSGLRTVTFDNRDTGGSTYFEDRPTPAFGEVMTRFIEGRPCEPIYTLEDMALDVVGLMDHLEIARGHVVGLSMGGYIGQILAARHPRRVRSFVSLMSSPYTPALHKSAPHIMEKLGQGPKGSDEQSGLDFAVEISRLMSGERFAADEQQFKAALRLEKQRGIAPGGETRQVMAMLGGGDREALCRQIRVPTLILHGTADPMLPFSEAETMARLIPESMLRPIEGAGHELAPKMITFLVQEISTFCLDRAK